MPTPNTTILSTLTVTDNTGALISNLSACTLIVTYPDSSVGSTLSIGSGITNLGSGQYQAKYNTKMPGVMREVWSVVAADTVTVANFSFDVGVNF